VVASRLWEQFKQFCCDINKVQHPDNVEVLYPDLPADFPEWIAMWIMDKCVHIHARGLHHTQTVLMNSPTELMILTFSPERQRYSACLESPMPLHKRCGQPSVTSTDVTMDLEHSPGWRIHFSLGTSGEIPRSQ
jgi:hypothetical protein